MTRFRDLRENRRSQVFLRRSTTKGFLVFLILILPPLDGPFDLGRRASNGMADDTKSKSDDIISVNDNQGPIDGPEPEAWKRVDRVALTLARIIGRRMAREDYAARIAANDNRPIASERPEGEADKD